MTEQEFLNKAEDTGFGKNAPKIVLCELGGFDYLLRDRNLLQAQKYHSMEEGTLYLYYIRYGEEMDCYLKSIKYFDSRNPKFTVEDLLYDCYSAYSGSLLDFFSKETGVNGVVKCKKNE